MSKTLLKAITVILIFYAITFYGCHSCYCYEEDEGVTMGDAQFRNYNKKIDIDDITFSVTAIDENSAKNSDTVDAVIYMMSVAEENYQNADYLARISLGGGSAKTSTGDLFVEGNIYLRSLYLRELDTNYNQTVGSVYRVSDDRLLGLIQDILNQGARSYTTNRTKTDWTTYIQEPKNIGNPTSTDTFPFTSCNFNEKATKTYNQATEDEENKPDEARGYLKNKNELTSFKIDADTLLASSCSVIENEDYYTVQFELDLTTPEKQENATLYPRYNLRKMALSDDLQYIKYKVKLEIWKNGLIKTWSTEQSLEATVNWGIFRLHGSTASTSADFYSYDHNDCIIQNYVNEHYISLDWIDN